MKVSILKKLNKIIFKKIIKVFIKNRLKTDYNESGARMPVGTLICEKLASGLIVAKCRMLSGFGNLEKRCFEKEKYVLEFSQ